MDGWDLVYPLPFIAAVVYLLDMVPFFQIGIADFSPCPAPFLRFGLLVPVGGRDGLAFVLPFFRVADFVAVPVKDVFFGVPPFLYDIARCVRYRVFCPREEFPCLISRLPTPMEK